MSEENFEYLYIDSVKQGGQIHVWVRDPAGLSIDTYDARDFYYCFIPDNSGSPSKYKDLWGTPMKKCSFDSNRDLRDFAQSESYVCESDVPSKYKVLIDEYSDASETGHFNYCLYDIEVDFDLSHGKGYPKPGNSYGEINLIQCWDNHHNRYTIFCLDHLKNVIDLRDEKFGIHIVWCWSERDMLQKFADYLDPIDVLSGWFSAGFDLPYIIERSIKLFGEKHAMTMYCRDGFKLSSREYVDEYGEERVEWQLVGRKHVDLMEVYKKFIPGERPSFSLDAICEEDLGMRKVQYEDDGDLGELYRQNPQKFCEYGVHDVRLLYELNEKHKLMDMMRTVAIGGSVLFNDVTGSVKPIEMGFMKFCREKGNIVLPDKKQHDKEKFPGAIVYDTIPGRHEWVFGIDLTSLYPLTMIMLGLSPETMIFQCEGNEDDYVRVITRDDSDGPITVYDTNDGEIEVILPSELETAIRENNWTISANGTIFDGTMGLLSEYLVDGFKKRKENQRLKKEYDRAGDDKMAAIYDLKQKVLKVARLNAIYGATGNEHFRLFDIRMARSVTLTARMISRAQAFKSNDLIEEVEKEL